MSDSVNHPPHYNSHESGVEAIDICEHMSFCIGNATKYVWRAGQKGDRTEDLKKARWYLERELAARADILQAWPALVLAQLMKIWETEGPSFLGKFLWALAYNNVRAALALVVDEIERAE